MAAFAVFPDGVRQRRYESWVIAATFLFVPLVPVLLLVSLPELYFNENFFWETCPVANPLFLPGMASLEHVAVGAWWARLSLVLLAAMLLALRVPRLSPEQRMQAKWPLFAVLAFALIGVGPLRL